MLASCVGLPWKFCALANRGDPGGGGLRFDAEAPEAVSAISVSDACQDNRNPDVSRFVEAWDKSTNSDHRGTIILTSRMRDRDAFAIYDLVASSTDHVGWTQLAVKHVQSFDRFANAEPLSVQFFRTGNTAGVAAVRDVVREIMVSEIRSTPGTTTIDDPATLLRIESIAQTVTSSSQHTAALERELADIKHQLAMIQGALGALAIEAQAAE